MGLSISNDELSLKSESIVGEDKYFKIQHNYNNIPIYGRTFTVIANKNGVARGISTNAINIKAIIVTPKISNEEIKSALKSHLLSLYQVNEFERFYVGNITNENLIIYSFDDYMNKPVLAYNITVSTEYGVNDVIINALNGTIISTNNPIKYSQNEFTYKGQVKEQTFVAESNNGNNKMLYKSSTGTEILVDTPKKDNVYDWYYDGNSTTVEWNDSSEPNSSAVDVMAHTIIAYKYYYEQLERDSFDGQGEDINAYIHITGYKNYSGENKDTQNNAFYWYSPNGSVMAYMYCFDENGNPIVDYSSELDVVGHEFTHGVIHYAAGLQDTDDNKMPGAINEAIADIMGYCIEANANKDKKLDWVSSARTSIKENNTNSNQIYHLSDYKGNYKECHSASTIVSYAAYLMTVYGNEDSNLSPNELSELWYRTILTLPSNCTFTTLRDNLEASANILGFSDEKKELIRKAFDTVGIEGTDTDEVAKYSTNLKISAVNNNGELSGNYKIIIDGKRNVALWGLFTEKYHKEIDITQASETSLELPKGTYDITVTDGKNSYTKKIKTRKNSENSELIFITDFGNLNATNNSGSKVNYDAILQAFLSTKEYLSYIRNVESSKLEYVIYDINSDEVPELLIQSTNEAPFYTTWTFAIDKEDVVLGGERYGYGQYRYSEKYNMLLVSPETKPFSGTGTTPFYSLEQNNLIYKFQVGEDLGESFYSDNNGKKVITAEEKSAYFENVINFTWLKINDFTLTETSQTTTERDIVLVLDVSGSMAGTPMEETKKASTNFISTILKENASIGIVTYDNSATTLSNFSTNESVLNAIANSIDDGGGTNIESGLQMAENMLSTSNAEKKIIVLMSDGSPNDGKTGEDLIAYADSIKDEGIYIYTLGFFESMGSSKSSAQILMEEIASDGCHYEVADADNLVFFFGDIADQINGQKYIYVRIACPVDVTVTYDGETLCSVEDDLSTRTNFGSLTFEDNEKEAEDSSDNRIKVLRLKDGADYDIKIEGNGRGRMSYTIGFMDESGEYSDLRKFTNIRISKRTQIDTVATNSSSTILNVDEDGDGKYDLKYKAKANGRGEIVDYTYLIYISIGTVVLIAILIIYIKFKKRSKNKNKT